MSIPKTQCLFCAHFDGGAYACPAYPDRIPPEIALNQVRHNTVRPDQVGEVVFAPKTPQDAAEIEEIFAEEDVPEGYEKLP
jgi:hypothetical protein